MLLHSHSDDQIISRIHKLTRRERTATLLVLLHLNEIERRKLHLALGYSSMFAFCTSGLGYSESDAGRRIQAARCIVRFPDVYGLLESNAVTIVTVSRVASILTAENKDALLARIRGRTQDEVDAVVAEYRPRAAEPRDRVEVIACRAVPQSPAAPLLKAMTTAQGADPSLACAPAPPTCETSNYSHNGSECEDRAEVRSVTELRLKYSFAASERFKAKLGRVQSLAAHRLPARASLEDVFELLMDEFIERKDPRKRSERREKRARAAEHGNANTASVYPRHIPASVRDRVFQRDGGCCAFVGRDGRRCASTHMLQVDHVIPVARGGPGTPDNLRLLCAYHNRFEAARMLGNAWQSRAVVTPRPVGRSPRSLRPHGRRRSRAARSSPGA